MNIVNSHRHGNHYYNFDRSVNSYFTTDVDLSGHSDISMVFKGAMVHSTDELRICGFSDSHTRMYWVHEIDKITPLKIQLSSVGGATGYYTSWSGDTLEHTYTFTYSSNNTDGNGISFYEDGTLITNLDDTDFSGWTGTSIVQIGSKNSADADINGYLGTMKRFQIYNRELTSGEVTTLQTDINGVTNGKIADFGDNKSADIWYDDVNGYEATNEGDVTLK